MGDLTSCFCFERMFNKRYKGNNPFGNRYKVFPKKYMMSLLLSDVSKPKVILENAVNRPQNTIYSSVICCNGRMKRLQLQLNQLFQ